MVDRRKRLLLPLILLLAGAGAYFNSLNGPFISDDTHTIVHNPHIRKLWPLSRSMTAPPGSGVAGRPLVCLSLAANYAAGGMNVWGYHVVNLGIHLAVGLTLFGLVRRTIEFSTVAENAKPRAEGENIAFAVALLWIVHPLTTDTVTFISNRSEAMMALFVLCALYCVNRAAKRQPAEAGRPVIWQIGAVVSTFLAVMCKEVAVVTPILALVYDAIFLDRDFGRRKWMYVGMFASWIVTIALLMQVDLASKAGAQTTISPWHYLLTQAGVIAMYLRLCFWPDPLVVDYDDWPIASSIAQVWPQGLIVVTLLAATIWTLWKRPGIGFLGTWLFLILAPTSSILPLATEVATERRMYLPLMAIVVIVVLAIHHYVRKAKMMIVLILAVALGIATQVRNATYANARTLWEDVLAHRPHNARAHTNLGIELNADGEVDAAIEHHLIALHFRPEMLDAHNNLGMALAKQNRFQEAIGRFTWVLSRREDYADVRSNLAAALAEMGNYDASIAEFEKALETDPYLPTARQLLPLVKKAKEKRDATTKSSR